MVKKPITIDDYLPAGRCQLCGFEILRHPEASSGFCPNCGKSERNLEIELENAPYVINIENVFLPLKAFLFLGQKDKGMSRISKITEMILNE